MALLLIFALIVAGLIALSWRRTKYWQERGVPGPESQLFIGNLWHLGKSKVKSWPFTYREWTLKYATADQVVGFQRGWRNALVVSNQQMAREIMHDKFEYFHERDIAPIGGDVDKDPLQHVFTSRGHLQPKQSNLLEKHVDGEEFNIHNFFYEYTMDVICKVGLGQADCKQFENKFTRLVIRILDDIEDGFTMLSWVIPFLGTATEETCSEEKSADFIDLFLDAELDEQIVNDSSGVYTKEKSVQILKKLSADELLAQCLLFLFAGFDTTANTLAFTSYYLAKYPNIQDKMRQEIEDLGIKPNPTYEDLQKLKYSEAVQKEVLRFYPIAAMAVSRKCVADTTIGGLPIEKGTDVILDLLTLHFDKKVWGGDANGVQARKMARRRWKQTDDALLFFWSWTQSMCRNADELGNQVNTQQPVILQNWTKKYGKVYGILRGWKPALVIADHELANQILLQRFEEFHGRDHPPIFGNEDDEPIINTFIARGKRWRRLRAISATAFSNKHLRSMFSQLTISSDTFMQELDSEIKANGNKVNIKNNFHEFAANVLFRVAIAEPKTHEEIQAFIPAISKLVGMPGSYAQFTSWMIPIASKFLKFFQIFQMLVCNFAILKLLYRLNKTIKSRKEENEQNADEQKEPVDFLDIFLKNESADVKLENNKLYDKHADKWLHEKTAHATEINGIQIEEDTHILIDVLSIHFDKQLWGEDVEKFNPDRWLGDDGKKFMSHFYGFGGGARVCVGMKLAYNELRLIMVKLLQNYRIKSTSQINLIPLNGNPDKKSVSHVFLARGHRWKRLRSLTSLAFTTKNLRKIFPIITSCSDKFSENLGDDLEKSSTIDFAYNLKEFTADVILRTAFGRYEDRQAIQKLINGVLDAFNQFRGLVFKFAWICPPIGGPLGALNRFIATFTNFAFGSFFFKLNRDINQRKKDDVALTQATEFDKKAVQHVDKHLSKAEILGTCILFMVAGFDTTANTLAFTVYYLALNPDVQEKLRQEIVEICGEHGEIDYDCLAKMKYNEAVMKETLRLKPIAAAVVSRRCMKATTIGGIPIEEGTDVILDTISLHTQKDVWGEDALEFRPEKWLESDVPSNQFYSFGAGPRLCIGMRLAIIEQKVCINQLAETLSHPRDS
ncbi:hypothetical protein M3Y97_00165400 [Aphelenchoides bicaudatus]|nr:hypothetical protein M3Y97_00165400 [Aphelenchoides bicaudatus]